MFNLGSCHGGDVQYFVDDVGILWDVYYDYVFVGGLEMCLGLQFGRRREEKRRRKAADGDKKDDFQFGERRKAEGCRENADVGNENFNR